MEWADLWGKALDQARLAKELRKYGVRSHTIRIGTGLAKGYLVDGEDGLAQAWRRYLPDPTSRNRCNSRDIAGQDVTPSCARGNSRNTLRSGRNRRNGGVTAETGAGLQGCDDVTGVTGVTPTDGWEGQHRNGFQPSSGPGRCGECGYHIETQGHGDECSVNTVGRWR
jgi:hypothetical protein